MAFGFVKKIGRAIAGGVRQVVNVAKTVVNRVVGIPGAILDLLGIRLLKRVRVYIRILRDETGTPVADIADVEDGLETAQRIFVAQANVSLKPQPLHGVASTAIVSILNDPAPTDALDVHCDAKAWGEDFAVAGEYFSRHLARNFFGTLFGAGAPITCLLYTSPSPRD